MTRDAQFGPHVLPEPPGRADDIEDTYNSVCETAWRMEGKMDDDIKALVEELRDKAEWYRHPISTLFRRAADALERQKWMRTSDALDGWRRRAEEAESALEEKRQALKEADEQHWNDLQAMRRQRDELRADYRRCANALDDTLKREDEAVARADKADQAIAWIGSYVGPTDEWTDQESMIADVTRTILSVITEAVARAERAEAALEERDT